MAKPSNWTDSALIELVTLATGGQSFAIDIMQIREIRRWTSVTRLPHSPPGVLGVMNLRGMVIPIIDLAERLGLGTTEATSRHVVIIVALYGRTMGLLVESVSEILTVRGDAIREAPIVRNEESGRYILGLIEIENDMTRIIDLAAVLALSQEEAA